MIGDSECTLGSLEKVNLAFGEYYGNHIGEIVNLQTNNEKYCPVGNYGKWWHTASDNNGADRAIRTDFEIKNIAEDSKWQNRPSYIKLLPKVWRYTNVRKNLIDKTR